MCFLCFCVCSVLCVSSVLYVLCASGVSCVSCVSSIYTCFVWFLCFCVCSVFVFLVSVFSVLCISSVFLRFWCFVFLCVCVFLRSCVIILSCTALVVTIKIIIFILGLVLILYYLLHTEFIILMKTKKNQDTVILKPHKINTEKHYKHKKHIKHYKHIKTRNTPETYRNTKHQKHIRMKPCIWVTLFHPNFVTCHTKCLHSVRKTVHEAIYLLMKSFYVQEFHHVDPNFIKLFWLAQLIIEYLLVSFAVHAYVVLTSFVSQPSLLKWVKQAGKAWNVAKFWRCSFISHKLLDSVYMCCTYFIKWVILFLYNSIRSSTCQNKGRECVWAEAARSRSGKINRWG